MEEQKGKKDKERIEFILDQLIQGNSLFEAFKKRPEFTPYEHYSIEIGEQTGALEKVVDQLSKFYKRKNTQRRMISSALSYHIIVLIKAILAITFMLSYVVPMFEGIFSQNNGELPGLTKMIISLSNLFSEYFHVGLILVFTLFIFGLLSRKKHWFRKMTNSIVQKILFVGDYQKKLKLAQFTGALHLLTSSKVSLVKPLELTQKMVDYLPLELGLEKAAKRLYEGKSSYESILDLKVFDQRMKSLIRVAEETHQNEIIFERLSNQYNEEIDYKSKLISSTIEPIIILVLGGFVALILIAMYLPMFTMSNLI